MTIHIRQLHPNEAVPYDLLLLADPSKEMVDGYINRGVCYIALLEEEMIGEFVLLSTRPATMELVNVAVGEKFQGKGIGKKLVLEAIEQAKNFGMRTLEIGTGNSSIHPLLLYQKCGFQITGVEKDFFTKHYEEPIFENGLQCKDMIRLSLDL
jgi:ribosomal protein S18 acetylase RimI-like enzyme